MAEVELPTPEELEEMKGKAFTRRVALTTAVFAVILAITSLGGSNATKEMLLAQQQASDQWAFYQAKAIRQHQSEIQRLTLELDLAEGGAAKSPEIRTKLASLVKKLGEEGQRYAQEKKEIESEARKLEQERDLNRSKDPYFDFAEVLLQIAIVMASVSILASSRPLFIFALLLAVVGALLTLNGYLLFAEIPFL